MKIKGKTYTHMMIFQVTRFPTHVISQIICQILPLGQTIWSKYTGCGIYSFLFFSQDKCYLNTCNVRLVLWHSVIIILMMFSLQLLLRVLLRKSFCGVQLISPLSTSCHKKIIFLLVLFAGTKNKGVCSSWYYQY